MSAEIIVTKDTSNTQSDNCQNKENLFFPFLVFHLLSPHFFYPFLIGTFLIFIHTEKRQVTDCLLTVFG